MKKLATTLCLAAFATGAFAQGTVNTANSAATAFHTNALALGGTSGNTATTLGGFVYEVLTASSTVTSLSSVADLTTPIWADTGLTLTNTSLGSGRVNAGTGATVQNWDAGASRAFIIVGWSANEGTTWAAVSAKLGALTKGTASGSTFWTAASGWVPGFFGYTTVQSAVAGGGSSGLPAFSLFGAGAGAQGTPVMGTTDLYAVTVPEPATMALAGLGAAALLIFRRRK